MLFFHSDYILSPQSFNIKRDAGVRIENMIDPKVQLSWLMPRVELGINVGLALVSLVFEYIRSYQQNKIVKGRIQGENNPPVEVELTTNPQYGLTGFRSPPQI